MEDGLVDVGPELLEDEGAGVDADVDYPSRERTFSNTASKWGINVGIDAGTFVFKEFWPDINHALFHTKD